MKQIFHITLGLFLSAGLVTATWANEALTPTQPRQLSTDPIGVFDYLQMFFGLLLVLGMILGMAWLIRRMGSMTQIGHGAMKVIGGLSVGQRERVVLVQVGETQILVGLAPGQIRTLHVLDKPISMDKSATAPQGSFAEKLNKLMQGKVR